MGEVKVYYGNNQFISATKDSVLMGESPVELVMKKHYDRQTQENLELKAMLEKAVEQRNGLCEGYSPHSGVEIRHYDAELQAAAEAVRKSGKA